MRLIDADELKKPVGSYNPVKFTHEFGYVISVEDIDHEPTIDPVKHGRWDLIDGCEPVRYGCSACHRMVWHHENYCPNCGAKMDEVEEDEID